MSETEKFTSKKIVRILIGGTLSGDENEEAFRKSTEVTPAETVEENVSKFFA